MRRCTFVPFTVATILTFGCAAPEPEPEPAADEPPATPQFAVTGKHPCDPVGEIGFICDMVSPEDIATIPGEEWAVTSGAREGGRLHLINVAEKTSSLLFPTPDRVEQLDAETYPECPGPIQNPDDSRPHGLYLDPGDGDVHTLMVVHHGSRESIEVFKVDTRSATPAIAWVGCVVAPEEQNLNSVSALPDGGFVTTSSGSGVYEWHTDTGWELLPESEDTAPNGIEISDDGSFVYIAGWAEEKLTRLSRGMTPIQKDVVQLGFRPDNLRMIPAGVILASGHTDKNGNSIVSGSISGGREPTLETTNVAVIDPETLEVNRIFVQPSIPGFIAATTATQIGDELWLGSYRGDRLAYLPMPE